MHAFAFHQNWSAHRKNNFNKLSKNLIKYRSEIILLDYQNNHVGIKAQASWEWQNFL